MSPRPVRTPRLSTWHLFLVALWVVPSAAGARCLSYPSQGVAQTVSFGTLQVPADAPVGSVIAEKPTFGWTSPGFKCIKPRYTAGLGIYTVGNALGGSVYDTNVPGVGVRVFFENNNRPNQAVPYSAQSLFSFDAQFRNTHFRVQLIKTGTIVAGGSLLAGTLARGGYDDQPQAWVDLLDARVEPQRPTCAFLSRRLLFALGKVDARDLAVAGSSHWATQQLVVTGCTNASQMLMTFSGAADAAHPSLFKLTGQGAATGVAVELRSDDPEAQALPNGAAPLVLPVRSEGQSFGFRARYRSTGTGIEPGAANASVTVNVAYR